jgi:hypothetical protein
MGEQEARYPEALRANLIAPCGMNCGLCSRAFRARDRCGGCRSNSVKPQYCDTCRIRNCDEVRAGGRRFCSECPKYPCLRLRRLDARYRTSYRMSMIENLDAIRERGLENFVALERQRWKCRRCGGVICVHKERCIYCGQVRN